MSKIVRSLMYIFVALLYILMIGSLIVGILNTYYNYKFFDKYAKNQNNIDYALKLRNTYLTMFAFTIGAIGIYFVSGLILSFTKTSFKEMPKLY